MQFSIAQRPSFSVPLALLAATSLAHAELWVVDQDEGTYADFFSIQEAIDAASDGDTILVLTAFGLYGTYPSFVIDGKSLSLIAGDDETTVGLSLSLFGYSEPAFEVHNLAAGQQVLVQGFQSQTGFIVGNCAGSVWVDDFHVDGFTNCVAGATDGALITNSSDVTVTNSTLRGETVSDNFLFHPHTFGVHAVASTLQLFDTEVWGSFGENDGYSPGPGRTGMLLEDSAVTISGCTVRGGAGGLQQDPFGGNVCAGTHAVGGAAVEFVGSGSVLRRHGSIVAGGAADLEALCPGLTGPAGPDFLGTGQVDFLGGTAHGLTANSPVRPGDALEFQLSGVAGELAAILISPGYQVLPFPAAPGLLLPNLSSVTVLSAGALPAGGEATFALPTPDLGTLDHLVFYAQAAFVDASPTTWLGAGTTVAVLDDEPLPYLYPGSIASWTNDAIFLEGGFLDEVVGASVDGLPVNILDQGPEFLTLERGFTAKTPGWSDIQLSSATGTAFLPKQLAVRPTLEVTSTGIGGKIETRITVSDFDDDEGIINTLYSLGTYTYPLTLQPAHYGLWLNLSAPSAIIDIGTLFSGAYFEDFPVPNSPGLQGVTIYLQSWTQGGAVVGGAQSFTNLVPITF